MTHGSSALHLSAFGLSDQTVVITGGTRGVGRGIAQRFVQAGGVQVLVNNAGGSPAADAATASPRFHAAIIDLNLTAALHCAQRARKSMTAVSGVGRIINIASTAGTRPAPRVAAYGAAKAGLLSLTRSLAVEWAPGIRVNAIVPGAVRTEQAATHVP